MFTESVIEELLKDDEGIHQAVMNYAYKAYEESLSCKSKWSYAELLDHCEENFGKFARLAIQVGNYNYQVCNGGHRQYFDNGYASRKDGGVFTNFNEIELFEEMTNSLEKFGFGDHEVMNVIKTFTIYQCDCYECDGQGYVYQTEEITEECEECDSSGEVDGEECYYCDGKGEYLSENEVEEQCYICGGYGESDEYAGRGNDNAYYKINEEWIKHFEEQLVEYYTNIIKIEKFLSGFIPTGEHIVIEDKK